ncbi:MAG: 30S ribosome-binding factor RbfA [Ruminococcaceae bacterium]|nr:30S ribosome-binding factor RbfA [Oscillospiraceae bacterium]
MAKYRQAKIDEEIARALGEIMRTVRDARLEGCVFSVTRVHAAPDLSTAEVFYSYIGNKSRDEVKKGIKSALGFIRSSLARKLSLRQTPELFFTYDLSMENGARIFELLKQVDIPEEEDENEDDGE